MSKYSQTLVGNWEDDPYNGLRTTLENSYQTNWEQLENDFKNLKDKIARNDELARIDYNKDLVNTTKNSYNRASNYYENLANRGLSSSGMITKLIKANTEARGAEVGDALGDLLATSEQNVEGLGEGGKKLLSNQRNLNTQIASDLGNITSQEFADRERYASTMAQINESRAARKHQQDIDRVYQVMAINDIMFNNDTTDKQKYEELVLDAGVTGDQAYDILSAYNYNKVSDKITEQTNSLNKQKSKLYEYYNMDNPITNSFRRNNLLNAIMDISKFGVQQSINKKNNKIDLLRNDLSKYSYKDLKDILGY